MPAALNPSVGSVLDTWGRQNNRRLHDHICETCGQSFRPKRSASRFCSRPCMWAQNGGQNRKEESWWVNANGYVEGRMWEGDVQRSVKAHRYVMELILGRRLAPSEDVHHIDGNKRNNHPTNLQVLEHGAHSSLSNMGRVYKRGYSLVLSADERLARAERMRAIRRLSIAKAEGR